MSIPRISLTNSSGDPASGTPITAELFTDLYDSFELNWTLDTWVPVLSTDGTAFTLNNGSVTGKYLRMGKLVIFSAKITMGSTTTYGTGNYSISLPATADTTWAGVIAVYAQDSSAGGALHNGAAFIATSTSAVLLTTTEAAGAAAGAYTPTTPITFANGDSIHIFGAYFRT